MNLTPVARHIFYITDLEKEILSQHSGLYIAWKREVGEFDSRRTKTSLVFADVIDDVTELNRLKEVKRLGCKESRLTSMNERSTHP